MFRLDFFFDSAEVVCLLKKVWQKACKNSEVLKIHVHVVLYAQEVPVFMASLAWRNVSSGQRGIGKKGMIMLCHGSWQLGRM